MRYFNMQQFIQALTALALICLLQSAYAALPISLNYQGHLTNDSGVPVDGAVNMVFAIYDVDSGGLALWSDTRSVTVNQGVFSVELGDGLNPLPPGLFEMPLWIGLTVSGDIEMAPRRPITSTAFAFKAGDANTLEGSSASTLDQSAHVGDTANPHSVTAAQVGAADAGTLASHIGNTSNPHSVTAAQTGAPSSVDFTIHTSNSAAHHLRYTNSEAVGAMGTKNDANALNHDKYSDANAVAAILAADGAGSTLDSDMVDGLQASEIIDAAQDEVRTPISSLPYTISISGSYYLTGNLDGSLGGINITADDVTLDLMGFTINGGGTSDDYGIYFSNHNNVTIRNGAVKGFSYAGIIQSSSSARYATVTDVKALGNGAAGLNAFYSGIYLYSSNSHVERCTAGENGGYGIYAATGSKLINNSVYSNTGYAGIYGGPGSVLSGNTAYHHNGNYGISGGSSTIISGNIAYDNSHWGIYSGGSGSLVKDNIIANSNASNTVGEGGLYVYHGSRVVGNKLNNNGQTNIYVSSSDNSIENNLVTDSAGNGIFFNASGNFYGNNRASGNAVNFNLNGTTQTTSTYLPNISF